MKKKLIFISILLILPVMVSGCKKNSTVIMDAYMEEIVTENITENSTEESDLMMNTTESLQDESAAGKEAGGCVYLCGAVCNPGVYTYEPGMRLYDILMEAGGFTSEASQSYWNLAAYVKDQDMIYIPTEQEVEEGAVSAQREQQEEQDSDETEDACALLNVNTATKEQLVALPGIGETKAEGIIAYRVQYGDFSKIEDIKNVSGIKDATYQLMKDYITVDGK